MPPQLFPLSTERAVSRIRAHEPRVRCYVTTRLDEALVDARRIGAEPVRGPLHGVPDGLKDEFDTPHLPTTGGSWRHRHRRTPGVASTPFRAFDEAGAVLVGKSNLSDMGLAPEASSYVGGSTANPFDPSRTAGGSSGGAAAAVAYGLHGFDWGTDIGGSIRLPAAFCGVLGLRLSHETWPIRELFPSVPESMAWLCGQGPFTRTVEQMRAVLDGAAPHLARGGARPFHLSSVALYAPDHGHWPTFATDVAPLLGRATGVPVAQTDALAPPSRMREIYAGIWASHFEELLAVDEGVTLASGLSAVLSAVVFRGAFGDLRFHQTTAELLLLIALGRITVFRDRERQRALAFGVRDAFARLWAAGQLVVAPVTAYPPPRILRSNRTAHLLSCTVVGNLADATGLAIPFGTFDGRLPRAIQLLGPPGSERLLLDVAQRIVELRDADPSLRQPATELDSDA